MPSESPRLATTTTLAVLTLLVLAAGPLGCAADWLGPGPAPLSVSEVVEMSQAGVPADEIILKMRESGTVYRLDASQLVRLHEQGVSDEVLNYMQETYLESVRENQRLQDMRLWSYGDDGYWYGGVPFGWPSYWIIVPDTPHHPHHPRRHH